MTAVLFFFFNDTATTEIYTLSLHDALPISGRGKLTFAPLELAEPPPPVALEGDHAAWRTVGSDPSPHQPPGETRRVVPRHPRDGSGRRPRGEPATGDGAAHLSADPAVPSHDVVRRDAAPQRSASAGELGHDLRRVPQLQRPG